MVLESSVSTGEENLILLAAVKWLFDLGKVKCLPPHLQEGVGGVEVIEVDGELSLSNSFPCIGTQEQVRAGEFGRAAVEGYCDRVSERR